MLNSINLRDFVELNQTKKDYVGKFLNIRFHVRIIWIIHANQTIQKRKKCFMSALIVCLWPGRLLTPGLNCKPCHFKASPKNRRIRGYVETQSLRIRVSYPRIQLFLGYCFEVAGYSAVTPTLVASGEPQGRLLISCIFFLPVYQDYPWRATGHLF